MCCLSPGLRPLLPSCFVLNFPSLVEEKRIGLFLYADDTVSLSGLRTKRLFRQLICYQFAPTDLLRQLCQN